MELYEKNGNILYILNVLKKFSDEEHKLKVVDIQRKIKEIYDVEIDTRTIRRNINLLKYKLEYDIFNKNLELLQEKLEKLSDGLKKEVEKDILDLSEYEVNKILNTDKKYPYEGIEVK